jgi:hypothetical protein
MIAVGKRVRWMARSGEKTTTRSDAADVTFPDANTIQVTAYRTVQPILGQLLGFDLVEVSAQARARIVGLDSSCVFQFLVTYDPKFGTNVIALAG